MELKDIRVGSLFGVPAATWWQKKLVAIQGAHTWHWGMFLAPVIDYQGDLGIVDWVTTEAGGKGTLISRLAGRMVGVWDINGAGLISPFDLLQHHSAYGEWPYDWDVNFRVAIWWLFKHYLGKILPIEVDKEVNCQEWICLMAGLEGFKLVPNGEYPSPYSLENSPQLEYRGVVNEH